MASEVRPIGRPNFRAIGGMDRSTLLKTREYFIVLTVGAWRKKDSDTISACLEWVDALCAEMALRGTHRQTEPEPSLIVAP